MSLPDLIKFLKFGLVGCTGLIIDFSLTYFLKEKIRINKFIANACGFTCAVVSNFFLNAYWTFNDDYTTTKLLLFVIISIAGLIINSSVVFMLVKKLNMNFYPSKAIAVATVFLWNFLMNNYITFGSAYI